MSIPSRFLEEVTSQLIENLGSRPPAQSDWSIPCYPKSYSRSPGAASDFADRHYNYEDENQEAPRSTARSYAAGGNKGNHSSGKPFVASWMTAKAPQTGLESHPKGKSAEAPPSDRK